MSAFALVGPLLAAGGMFSVASCDVTRRTREIDEAEKAALAILAFPARLSTRADTILALKLLALVAGKRRLEHPIRGTCGSRSRPGAPPQPPAA